MPPIARENFLKSISLFYIRKNILFYIFKYLSGSRQFTLTIHLSTSHNNFALQRFDYYILIRMFLEETTLFFFSFLQKRKKKKGYKQFFLIYLILFFSHISCT